MLAAASPKLKELHDQRKSMSVHQEPQRVLISSTPDKGCPIRNPEFSILDELVLNNFPALVRKGQDDHALLSAFMLTFVFAITASSVDAKYLEYQSQALGAIRRRMDCPDTAASESTLGAILLLAGTEVWILPVSCIIIGHGCMGAKRDD